MNSLLSGSLVVEPRSGMSLWKIIALVFVGLCIAAGTSVLWDTAHGGGAAPAAQSTPEPPKIADCSPAGIDGQVTATGLIKAWRDGDNSAPYWALGLEAQKLYAVT